MVDWVRLRLDVETFDDGQFEPYVQRAHATGVTFTTMAEQADRRSTLRAQQGVLGRHPGPG
jgi:hypothetical protein